MDLSHDDIHDRINDWDHGGNNHGDMSNGHCEHNREHILHSLGTGHYSVNVLQNGDDVDEGLLLDDY